MLLSDRLEALTGPCEKTDSEIRAALNYDVPVSPLLPYTASLDAAMTLIPANMDYGHWRQSATSGVATISSGRALAGAVHGFAATPAIALTAAALRSRGL